MIQFQSRTLIQILIGIILSLQINLEKSDLIIIQTLPLQKHGITTFFGLPLMSINKMCIFVPLKPAFYSIIALAVFPHYIKSRILWTVALTTLSYQLLHSTTYITQGFALYLFSFTSWQQIWQHLHQLEVCLESHSHGRKAFLQ